MNNFDKLICLLLRDMRDNPSINSWAAGNTSLACMSSSEWNTFHDILTSLTNEYPGLHKKYHFVNWDELDKRFKKGEYNI